MTDFNMTGFKMTDFNMTGFKMTDFNMTDFKMIDFYQQDYDLEGSENCEFDSLSVYNGPDQVKHFLAKQIVANLNSTI